MLTQAVLRASLSYDPDTGLFRWARNVRNKVRAGQIAGSIDAKGYIDIGLNGGRYKAHVLAWLYVHGEWPPSKLDHKDRNKGNNRILNLRPATPSENGRNVVRTPRGQYGPGITRSRTGKFYAQICVEGRRFYSQHKLTPAEAVLAHIELQRQHHGEFSPLQTAGT